MNAMRKILLGREMGLVVMIVLIVAVVGFYKPHFLSLNSLRIVMLLVPLIMIVAMGQMMVLV
ncbi:MAG: ABC transporter permease, partial [Alphaproteobacteria bacterium]